MSILGISNIETSAKQLLQLLETKNTTVIPVSGYPKAYLEHLLQHKEHYIAIYKEVFRKIIEKTKLPPQEIVFVDYGTGNGLMAILAVFAGFHKVAAVDVDADFVNAAKQLAGFLNIEGIQFLHGAEETLKEIETKGKQVVVAGTDVIEHIYNLDTFFSVLSQIPGIAATVFTTASNPKNPRIVKRLTQLQIKEELHGGDADDRLLFGDAHASFLSMRKKIIHDFKPTLPGETAEALAKASRGLHKEDIHKITVNYLENGEMPLPISHASNTCNPETGSWCERLLELETFEILYAQHGFSLEVSNGFYDQYKGAFVKRIAVKLINQFIRTFSSFGISIAPFIILTGTKK